MEFVVDVVIDDGHDDGGDDDGLYHDDDYHHREMPLRLHTHIGTSTRMYRLCTHHCNMVPHEVD